MILILLLLACAFFAASEMAFVSCDWIKLLGWVSEERKGAKFAANFLRKQDKFLMTVLVGTNLAVIGLSVECSRLWHGIFPEWLIVILVALIVLGVGEILPKALAMRFKERLAVILARPYTVIYWLFYPMIWVVRLSSLSILKLSNSHRLPRFPKFTKGELQIALRRTLPRQELDIVSRLLDFSKKSAEDIMIPRPYIKAASIDSSIHELRQIMTQTGYSRIPIYQASLDDMLGIVEAKDLLTAKSMQDILKPCLFVHETKPISQLLDELREKNVFLSIVKDEYGGTSGIVTMEDILEELFGEIWDEYDKIESIDTGKRRMP